MIGKQRNGDFPTMLAEFIIHLIKLTLSILRGAYENITYSLNTADGSSETRPFVESPGEGLIQARNAKRHS
jgi:hypothetical protein